MDTLITTNNDQTWIRDHIMAASDFIDFLPSITMGEAQRLGANLAERSAAMDVHTRIALVTVAKDKSALLAMAELAPTETMDGIESLQWSIDGLKSQLELLEAAHARLLLCMGEVHGEPSQ